MKKLKKDMLYVILTALGIVMIFPFFWMISCAFRRPNELLTSPPRLLPASPTVSSFIHVLFETEVPRYFMNSVIDLAALLRLFLSVVPTQKAAHLVRVFHRQVHICLSAKSIGTKIFSHSHSFLPVPFIVVPAALCFLFFQLLQITAQSVLPVRKPFKSILRQLFLAHPAVARPLGLGRIGGGIHRCHLYLVHSGLFKNLTGELVPAADSLVGGVVAAVALGLDRSRSASERATRTL